MLKEAMQAPEGTTFLVVVSSGLTGSWFRSKNLIAAVEGARKQADMDFGIRKGTTYVATVFHVDDVEWSIGVDGVHSPDGKVHERCLVKLTAKHPGTCTLEGKAMS